MFALRASEPMLVFELSVATLFACKKAPLDETIAKHRVGVEAKFAAIKALEPLVNATPELDNSSVKPPAEPLILERESGGQNATYVYQEDLKDPATAGSSISARSAPSSCPTAARSFATPCRRQTRGFAFVGSDARPC